MYWNYFYHTWKTVSYSPFANCVVFTTGDIPSPDAVHITVAGKDTDSTTGSTVITFGDSLDDPANAEFIQTEALTTAGVAVQKYGAVIIPSTSTNTEADIEVKSLDAVYKGSGTTKLSELTVGTTLELYTKKK